LYSQSVIIPEPAWLNLLD